MYVTLLPSTKYLLSRRPGHRSAQPQCQFHILSLTLGSVLLAVLGLHLHRQYRWRLLQQWSSRSTPKKVQLMLLGRDSRCRGGRPIEMRSTGLGGSVVLDTLDFCIMILRRLYGCALNVAMNIIVKELWFPVSWMPIEGFCNNLLKEPCPFSRPLCACRIWLHHCDDISSK